jgi:hypothetical protein
MSANWRRGLSWPVPIRRSRTPTCITAPLSTYPFAACGLVSTNEAPAVCRRQGLKVMRLGSPGAGSPGLQVVASRPSNEPWKTESVAPGLSNDASLVSKLVKNQSEIAWPPQKFCMVVQKGNFRRQTLASGCTVPVDIEMRRTAQVLSGRALAIHGNVYGSENPGTKQCTCLAADVSSGRRSPGSIPAQNGRRNGTDEDDGWSGDRSAGRGTGRRLGPARMATRAGPPVVGSLRTQAVRPAVRSKIAIGSSSGPVWLMEPWVRIQGRVRRR